MTDLRHFDLNLLIAFDLLMQERNVLRAAERLFLSQSAMSHILQRLRQQLEDPLLVKTPAGMKPTARAIALIDPVRGLLRELEELIRTPGPFDPATSRRRFVIAATDYMDYLVVPRLVKQVSREAPNVEIQIKRTEVPFPEHELDDGSLDVVLGFEAILKPPTYLNCDRLFTERMACLIRNGESNPRKPALSLEEYVAMNHMLISRTGTRIGVIDAWLEEKGRQRRIAPIVPLFFQPRSSLRRPIWSCPCRFELPNNVSGWLQ